MSPAGQLLARVGALSDSLIAVTGLVTVLINRPRPVPPTPKAFALRVVPFAGAGVAAELRF